MSISKTACPRVEIGNIIDGRKSVGIYSDGGQMSLKKPSNRVFRKSVFVGIVILAVVAVIIVLVLTYRGGRVRSLKINNQTLVCIDPGHGGIDYGAIANGIVEKRVNLDIALRTRPLVEANGIRVVMTRETDKTVSLQERCVIADRARASIFVSIHNNYYVTQDQGTETYYYNSDPGRRLANYIQREVVDRIQRPDNGVTEDDLYVLRNTRMPSALLEGVYLTNEYEAQLIQSPDFRQKIAEGVAEGIVDYLKG
jgi:N-acetylmuramoyl-L-alanine amidase